MSTLLRRLQRDPKFQKQPEPPAPAPADTAGLGDALAQVIRAQVQQQVQEAVKQAPAPAKPRTIQEQFDSPPLSSEWPDPPPRTAPPKDFTMNVQRDELGRIKTFTVGNDAKFELQRNGEGKTVRVVKLD